MNGCCQPREGAYMRLVRIAALVVFLVSEAAAAPDASAPTQVPADVLWWLFVGRAAERIVIVVIGGLTLYLGFRLFDKSLASDSSLDAGAAKYYLRLKKVGPG